MVFLTDLSITPEQHGHRIDKEALGTHLCTEARMEWTALLEFTFVLLWFALVGSHASLTGLESVM